MQYLTKSSIEAVRRFNRFYTGRIGVLPRDYLGSGFTLGEARLVSELGRRGAAAASELGRELDLDLGYLSRLVHGLRRRGVLQARRAREDARRSILTLTARGQKAFQALDARSRKEIGERLAPLAPAAQAELAGAMRTIERLLGGEAKPGAVALRAHRPGDIGWVVRAHGRIYHEEYGWDERFEALVAGIAKDFVENLDASRERCWIAELDGEPVGSVFLVRQSKRVAKLRLLIVEPRARGRGLGRRLVEECIGFARAKGYRKLVVWTQSNLAAARAIYRRTGFRKVKQERHRQFGVPLLGEYWELAL